MSTDTTALVSQLQAAKSASFQLFSLSGDQKNTALETFAQLIEHHAEMLLEANRQDLAEQAGQIAPAMAQRLKLDKGKLVQLVQGIRDMKALPDPVGHVLKRTLLDDELLLEKVSVPLGVIAIIFESRPDVLPQIVSLALKSSNAVVLKGGKEATHSNTAFISLVKKLGETCTFLPPQWAQLIHSREQVQEILNYPQYIDLVIPRGSNQLVQSIMASTHIPVLGHADGICHLYVHPSAHLEKAIEIVLDAKTQYPSACNALETLLIDRAIAPEFLARFVPIAQDQGVTLKGCELTRQCAPHATILAATEEDWRTEYGDLTLAIRIVEEMEAAIAHINHYGSHHTDGILAQNPDAEQFFLNAIDSACVFVNASTRFADGFRFGFGAEVGISTAKTHARGPVGLEGLVIYQYRLHGNGQIVADYVGESAKTFKHVHLE